MKIIIYIVVGLLLFHTSYAQDYPIDNRTKKITFTDTVKVKKSKEILFKRVEQFVISQNFDRVENIRCKDKSHVTLQLVDLPITYKDFEDGKYIGNGFVNFEYRGKERFVLLFKYQIAVKDNYYKYQFTDFQVLEFVTAPTNKGKSKSMGTGGGGFAFGSSSGKVEFSANDVRKWDLEEFSEKGAFDRSGSDDVFRERINRLIGDLHTTMKDDF